MNIVSELKGPYSRNRNQKPTRASNVPYDIRRTNVIRHGGCAFTCEGRGNPSRSIPPRRNHANGKDKTHSPFKRPIDAARIRGLEARAHAAAIEISAFVRKTILDAPVPQYAKRRSPDIAALGRAIVALNRVGSNINQVAKAANQTGEVRAYSAAEADRAALAEAARAIMAALRVE